MSAIFFPVKTLAIMAAAIVAKIICDSGHLEDLLFVADDNVDLVLCNLTPSHAIDLLERYGACEVAKVLARKKEFVVSCFSALLERAENSLPSQRRVKDLVDEFYFHLNMALHSVTGKSPLFYYDSTGIFYRLAGSGARQRKNYSQLILTLAETVPSDVAAYFVCKHEVEVEVGYMKMPTLQRLWTGKSAFSSLPPQRALSGALSFDATPESAAMQDFWSWSLDADLTCAPRGSFKKFSPRNSNKALYHTLSYAHACYAFKKETEALGYFVQAFCFYSHATASAFEDHDTLAYLKMDMYLLGAITLSKFGHSLKDLATKFLVAAAGELFMWTGNEVRDARVAQFLVGAQEVFGVLGYNYSAAYVHNLVKGLPNASNSGTYFLRSCILHVEKKIEVLVNCLVFLSSKITDAASPRTREERVLAEVARKALDAYERAMNLALAAVKSDPSHPFRQEFQSMRTSHELYFLLLECLDGRILRLSIQNRFMDLANRHPAGTSVHHMCLILLDSPHIAWHQQEILRCAKAHRDVMSKGKLSPALRARTAYVLCVQLYTVGRLSTLLHDIFFDSLEDYIVELERCDPTNDMLPSIKFFQDLVFPPTDRLPSSYTASTFLSKSSSYSYPNRVLFGCGCRGRPRSDDCRCFGHMAQKGRLFMMDTEASRPSDEQLGKELLENATVDHILSTLPLRGNR